MNNTVRTSFQVGLLVVIAAVVAIAAYVFFNGTIREHDTYEITALFNDAQGIQKQANVLLSGVKIGTVKRVSLNDDDGRAKVELSIDKRYLNKIPKGSVITISASLLGGSSVVTIVPAPHSRPLTADEAVQPNDTIEGQNAVNFEALQDQVGGLVKQFGTTTAKANKLLDDVMATTDSINMMLANPKLRNSLLASVDNINQATANGVLLTKELRETLNDDNNQLKGVLSNVNGTTSDLKDVMDDNKAKISLIVDNLNQTTQSLSNLTAEANKTLTRGQTVQNVSDLVANLKDASIKMDKIAADIQGLTGDKSVQSDLKMTVHNAALASSQTKILVERLSAITGGHGITAGKGDLKFESRLDFTQNFRTNNFRTDFDIYAPLSSMDFARFGIYDLTEKNRLNLQYGQKSPYNKFFSYRAGVHAGKVGVGADYDLFGNSSLSFDLYDPNRPRLDAVERLKINRNSSLSLGVDDFPRTNAFTFGLDLQR